MRFWPLRLRLPTRLRDEVEASRLAAAAGLCVGCGCASNLRTVGNAEAATMWHEARYRASCVGTGGPPAWCNGLRTALNGDEMEANAANAAQKVGKLRRLRWPA